MNTITLDNNIKAASRKDAFHIITMALNGKRELDPSSLESLYKFFMPKMPKKVKTAEQWVGQAVGVKDVREFTHYIHVLDGVMYATDGHRIHFAPTELEDGTYHPVTMSPVKFTQTKPDLKRIIPTEGQLRTTQLASCEVVFLEGSKLSHITIEDVRLNQKYVEQATNGEGCMHATFRGPNDAIRGRSMFGEFVIMPMRK
jgi:hypothetical protein